jgi:hypothetical protein
MLAAWHVSRRLSYPTPLLYTQGQYQRITGGSYVEKSAKKFRLASGYLAIYSRHLTTDLEDMSLNPLYGEEMV